jgi:hypothetical protein
VWLKLARARRHRADLAAEVASFLARRPFGSRHESEPGDGAAMVHHVFAVVNEQPPVEWAPIIGDAVHNLRSALDHVLWACADPNERHPRAQYPLCSTEADYDEKAARWLRGVSARRCDLIRGTQPYRWAEPNRAWHGGAVLQRLDNDDKHRTLHTLAAFAENRWTGVSNAELRTTMLLPPYASLDDGVEVWRFEATPNDPSQRVVVTPVIEMEVGIKCTFGDLLSTIDHLARFVEWDVVRPLEHPDHPMFAGLPLDDVGGSTTS